MNVIEMMTAEFLHEAQTTRRMLERVPEEKFGWKPHEKSMSLGQLATHIAEIPWYAESIVEQDEFKFEPGTYKPHVVSTVKELLALFDKNVQLAEDKLESLDEVKGNELWRFCAGEQVIFELPRVAVLRSMVLNHIVHHRGQLSVFLRLNNVPLPSVYGPTADES